MCLSRCGTPWGHTATTHVHIRWRLTYVTSSLPLLRRSDNMLWLVLPYVQVPVSTVYLLTFPSNLKTKARSHPRAINICNIKMSICIQYIKLKAITQCKTAHHSASDPPLRCLMIAKHLSSWKNSKLDQLWNTASVICKWIKARTQQWLTQSCVCWIKLPTRMWKGSVQYVHLCTCTVTRQESSPSHTEHISVVSMGNSINSLNSLNSLNLLLFRIRQIKE